MLHILATLSIALFLFWLLTKMIKAEFSEKTEEIEIKIGSLENKIDELYTVVYKLGNTIQVVWPVGNTEVAPDKKRGRPVSEKALKMREYRAKKKKSPSRSEKMKAYWEKRREENIKASVDSAEKRLQELLAAKE